MPSVDLKSPSSFLVKTMSKTSEHSTRYPRLFASSYVKKKEETFSWQYKGKAVCLDLNLRTICGHALFCVTVFKVLLHELVKGP